MYTQYCDLFRLHRSLLRVHAILFLNNRGYSSVTLISHYPILLFFANISILRVIATDIKHRMSRETSRKQMSRL